MNNVKEISANDAAAILNISDQSVRRLIKSGELKARRKTSARKSAYLVDMASVLAYRNRPNQ